MGNGSGYIDDTHGLKERGGKKWEDRKFGSLARSHGSSALKGVVDRLFPRRGLPDLRERRQT